MHFRLEWGINLQQEAIEDMKSLIEELTARLQMVQTLEAGVQSALGHVQQRTDPNVIAMRQSIAEQR